MKIQIMIVVCTILAILVDIYIYRRVIVQRDLGRMWRIAYVIYALLVDTIVLSALIRMGSSADPSPQMMRALMWAIAIFFLNLTPKILYTLVSSIDYLMPRRQGRRGHTFGYVGTALGVVVALVLLHGMTLGRSTLRVETVEMVSDKLPASFDGTRVVFFSDTHIGTLINPDRMLQKTVDAVNALQPDIVISGGDIVNSVAEELDPAKMEILAGIKSRLGVYSVLGNHDLGIYARDSVRYPMAENILSLRMRQQAMGWNVLVDESIMLSNGTDSIAITGLDYPYDPTLNSSHVRFLPPTDLARLYEGIPDSLFNLVISHAPQTWDRLLAAGRGDLTLSGHVHSMQTKIRLGDWQWSPAALMYDRWSGLYEENGRYLYINDGIGYVLFPMRIGTKPEITLITLRSGAKK